MLYLSWASLSTFSEKSGNPVVTFPSSLIHCVLLLLLCRTLCFIMQFVERGSLADLLKNKKLQFSFDSKGTFQLLVAARDLASGLAHLHTHGESLPCLFEGKLCVFLGIVHRDVATRNLLVNEAGRVLLSDFGMQLEHNPLTSSPCD